MIKEVAGRGMPKCMFHAYQPRLSKENTCCEKVMLAWHMHGRAIPWVSLVAADKAQVHTSREILPLQLAKFLPLGPSRGGQGSALSPQGAHVLLPIIRVPVRPKW